MPLNGLRVNKVHNRTSETLLCQAGGEVSALIEPTKAWDGARGRQLVSLPLGGARPNDAFLLPLADAWDPIFTFAIRSEADALGVMFDFFLGMQCMYLDSRPSTCHEGCYIAGPLLLTQDEETGIQVASYRVQWADGLARKLVAVLYSADRFVDVLIHISPGQEVPFISIVPPLEPLPESEQAARNIDLSLQAGL